MLWEEWLSEKKSPICFVFSLFARLFHFVLFPYLLYGPATNPFFVIAMIQIWKGEYLHCKPSKNTQGGHICVFSVPIPPLYMTVWMTASTIWSAHTFSASALGPGRLFGMLQILQKECDRQTRKIIEQFKSRRQYDRLVGSLTVLTFSFVDMYLLNIL